jgi:hypothetical protein
VNLIGRQDQDSSLTSRRGLYGTTGVGAAEFWPELLEHAIRASGTRASTVSRRIGPFCDTSQTRAATSLDLQLAPFRWACDNDCAFGSAPASCAAQLDPLRGHDAVLSVSDGSALP